MPATTSPFFGINYGWTTGENSWGDPVNANFKALSFLGKGAVDSFVASLPVSPSDGDSVVLTTDNQFYVRIGGNWLFIQPQDGMEVNETSTGKRWQFESGVWSEVLIASQLETALADPTDPSKGSAMAGHYNAQAPAYLKTVSDILNMEPVSVLRLVPNGTETTALHNGTSTFPLAASLNSVISDMNSAGGGKIELTWGVHRLENYVEFLSNFTLEGLGDASVFSGMFDVPISRMLTSPADVLQYNINMRNFKLDRSVANTEHGIITGGIDGLVIDNVTIDGFSPGVTSGAMGISPFNAFAAVQSRNVDIKNCKINSPNNFGIAFGNVSGGTLTKNLFTNAWREAIGLECWGNPSVIEDIVVSGNVLRMSSAAANHVGGSVGPGILVGGAGASYAGLTRRCTLSGNIITIDNPAGITGYNGISVIGGPSAPLAVEDIILLGNTIYNAPGDGIQVGALGSVSRRVVSRGNTILNPNSGPGGTSSAIHLRNAQDCVFQGDVIVGSTHVHSVFEDVGSSGNTFLDVTPGTPTTDKFFRTSATSIYRDSTTNQVIGGHLLQENISIANGATAAYTARTNPNRGIYLLTTNSGAYAILVINSTAVPVVIAKSADVVVGATDPGTAGAFSVFPTSNTTISVTNRIGSTRDVTIQSLNAN